tara:strand:+ start:233 stop:412 length:180 start_codon:yes stop_codon:yes gene_type:complete
MNWIGSLYIILFGYSLGLMALPLLSPSYHFNSASTYIVMIGGALSAVIWFMLYYNRKFD